MYTKQTSHVASKLVLFLQQQKSLALCIESSLVPANWPITSCNSASVAERTQNVRALLIRLPCGRVICGDGDILHGCPAHVLLLAAKGHSIDTAVQLLVRPLEANYHATNADVRAHHPIV